MARCLRKNKLIPSTVMNTKRKLGLVFTFSIALLAFVALYLKPSVPSKWGVSVYKKDLSYQGLNLYNLRAEKKAFLIDMYGRPLHVWHDPRKKGKWHYSYADQKRNLYVIVKDRSLTKLDKHSKIVWSIKGRFHHDFDFYEGGMVALARQIRKINYNGKEIPILDDFIYVIDKKQRITSKISLYETLQSLIPKERIMHAYLYTQKRINSDLPPNSPADLLHTNSIQYLKADIKDLCKKGDILIASFALNLIAIIDPIHNKIRWHSPLRLIYRSNWPEPDIKSRNWVLHFQNGWKWKGPQIEAPHTVKLLPKGTLLLFDNGYFRGYSRVLEIDPISWKEIWQYDGGALNPFFSFIRGGAERLPNGNTLITNSMQKEVIEVTHEGEIVWRYKPPYKDTEYDAGEKKGIMYRMVRIPDTRKNLSFLKKIKDLLIPQSKSREKPRQKVWKGEFFLDTNKDKPEKIGRFYKIDFNWSAYPPFLPSAGQYAPPGYSAVFTADIFSPKDLVISFRLGSDDGSRLTVDDTVIIDNWGEHSFIWKEGKAFFHKGYHTIKVEYFERGGKAKLALMGKKEGGGSFTPYLQNWGIRSF
ncbi:MAG: hypothetical protein D6808_07805 [Candidatus Dadabacteria bacterium]|nr:MAG: hypothetical protein D6808_07805 [Candidatus Dadabacteria bacterium]